jgi:hypothetical protein
MRTGPLAKGLLMQSYKFGGDRSLESLLEFRDHGFELGRQRITTAFL